jgi:hypothetical protein
MRLANIKSQRCFSYNQDENDITMARTHWWIYKDVSILFYLLHNSYHYPGARYSAIHVRIMVCYIQLSRHFLDKWPAPSYENAPTGANFMGDGVRRITREKLYTMLSHRFSSPELRMTAKIS